MGYREEGKPVSLSRWGEGGSVRWSTRRDWKDRRVRGGGWRQAWDTEKTENQ